MKLFPSPLLKVVYLTLISLLLFSCTKDSDLFMDAVFNDPAKEFEERATSSEENEGDDDDTSTSSESESEGSTTDGTETDATTEDPVDETTESGEMVTKTFTFYPINDAYIDGETGYNQDIMRIEEGRRTAFLMFDLSTLEGTIKSASLQFTVHGDNGDGTLIVEKGLPGSWSENDLSATNAPAADIEIGTVQKQFHIGSTEKIDLVSPEVQPELTSLILSHSGGNDLAIASKENQLTSGPKLVVTYETYAGAEDPQSGEASANSETADTSSSTNTEDSTTQNHSNTNSGVHVDYYVTTSGSAYNDGKSEATAWSIEHAFNNAPSGSVVYIKAGDYGNLNLTVDNAGNPGAPIKFIGYRDSPGDILSNGSSTFRYGDQLSAAEMPLLSGRSLSGEGQGTGIRINEPYIHLENFQITNYVNGLWSTGNNNVLKNIIVSKVGDYNPAHSYPSATSNAFLNYSGNGIIVNGSNTALENCFVLNAGAQGITIKNAYAVIANNNAVYSDSHVNPTDYYFLIGEETQNSQIRNTKVHRVGELEHLGHGIAFKGNGTITNNLVDGFEIINTFLEVQFPKTSNNTFQNGIIIKESDVNNNTTEAGGIRLANGSHHNQFRNITLDNCSIKFADWNDGLAGDVNESSDFNDFDNVTVRNGFSGVAFSYFHVTNHASSADNNTFTNCTFSNLNFLFEVDRANSGTVFRNCTIENVNAYSKERIEGGPSYDVDLDSQNSTWINVGFNPPN